ncbi:MAG: MFS transporter [Betaproteobacteria bacterium]|nr:MAG: MFS transporter [Betaproteobacteria bacterium]
MRHPFRALRHRDFALFVLGQGAGILGYWIQQLAVHWLMYRLTGSAFLLGVTVFAAQIPVLILGPIAGAMADRVDRHRAFVVVQTLQLLQAFAMATLAYLGIIQPWHMIALAMFLGMTIAVELPVRHAYLPDLLGSREDLPNAVAVTSFTASAGRLVGPSVAGIVIAVFNEATCFLINGLSYFIVLATLAAIRRRPSTHRGESRPMLADLREGASYAWRSRPIRVLLGMLAVVSFMATPYQPLMPAFVREAYAGGPQSLGFLVAAAGLGALVGTGFLSARGSTRGLISLITVSTACAGIALAAFSVTRWFPLSLLLMAIVGFGILATTVSVSMILQSLVEDRVRGRVMSLYTAAFLGVAPLGGFVAGAAADKIGAASTLAIGGICCTIAGLALARIRRQLGTDVVRKPAPE